MAATVVVGEKSLAYIPVDQIRESAEALRPVDRKNPEYVLLADSVALNGVLSAISVRKMEDPETGETFYSLVDGLQRWTASKDAGLPTVPAQIISSSDCDVLKQQIIANTSRVETTPAQHSKQLQRVLQMEPTLTRSELAHQLSRGTQWLDDRLSLVKLTPEAAKLVDSNTINLLNAYCLAKLPLDEQESYTEQAMSLQHGDFSNLVKARLDAINKAKRANAADAPSVFVHKPYLRKPADVVAESESGVVGAATIAEQRITSPEDAWKAALLWAATSDKKSVDAAKAKFDAMEAERNEKKAKAALERERKKLVATDIKGRRQKLEFSLAEAGASAEEKAAKLAEFDAQPENKPPVAAKKAATEEAATV